MNVQLYIVQATALCQSLGLVRRRILRHMTDGQYSNFRIYCMQILNMHNLTQNYRINLAARGILQSHGTLRHMTVESNNGIEYNQFRQGGRLVWRFSQLVWSLCGFGSSSVHSLSTAAAENMGRKSGLFRVSSIRAQL
jgi:hypothetical protein